MQSSNPVFRRAEGFNGRSAAGQTYAGNGFSYPSYGAPASPPPGYATPGGFGSGQDPFGTTAVDQGRMTIDSVVQKTGITLGVVALVAAATWFLTGDLAGPDGQQVAGTLYLLAMVGALGG